MLRFPDENFVRIFQHSLRENPAISEGLILDLGCGSGRHIHYLAETGIQSIGVDLADLSATATNLQELDLKENHPKNYHLIQANAAVLPARENCFSGCIAWGSLHYGSKNQTQIFLEEILRVLKPGFPLWGTLRSDYDTFFDRIAPLENGLWEVKSPDLEQAYVSFFTQEEVEKLLSNFSSYKIGLMERTQLGQMHKRISHFYFEAVK